MTLLQESFVLTGSLTGQDRSLEIDVSVAHLFFVEFSPRFDCCSKGDSTVKLIEFSEKFFFKRCYREESPCSSFLQIFAYSDVFVCILRNATNATPKSWLITENVWLTVWPKWVMLERRDSLLVLWNFYPHPLPRLLVKIAANLVSEPRVSSMSRVCFAVRTRKEEIVNVWTVWVILSFIRGGRSK